MIRLLFFYCIYRYRSVLCELSYWEVVWSSLSAWYLNQAGHEVTVIDREPGAAAGNQCGKCWQISPGYAAPSGGAPGVPLKAIKWMFQRHAPLAVRLDGTQFQLKWMWQLLRNCDTSHYMENKGRMVRLAEYSHDCLKALRASVNQSMQS